MNDLRLILASTSPRRRELLESLGLQFEVVDPEVDEHRHPNEEPFDYVARIARVKVEASLRPGAVVVAADTVVVIDGHVLGKPGHPEEAKTMLRRLDGITHEVLTGVADFVFHDSRRRAVRTLPCSTRRHGSRTSRR